jgi:succinate dehydrogenase/fumarate reductase flavoprotein subunit
MALDIVRAPDGHVAGVVGVDLKGGDAHLFRAKTVIVATGGYVWASGCTINGPESTGEGHAMFIRQGLPMKDMEFFQTDFESARPYGTRSKEKDQIEIAFGPDLNGDDFMYAYNKKHEQYNKKYFSNPQLSAYPGAAFQGTVTTAIKEIVHGNGTTGAGSNNGILLAPADDYDPAARRLQVAQVFTRRVRRIVT